MNKYYSIQESIYELITEIKETPCRFEYAEVEGVSVQSQLEDGKTLHVVSMPIKANISYTFSMDFSLALLALKVVVTIADNTGLKNLTEKVVAALKNKQFEIKPDFDANGLSHSFRFNKPQYVEEFIRQDEERDLGINFEHDYKTSSAWIDNYGNTKHAHDYFMFLVCNSLNPISLQLTDLMVFDDKVKNNFLDEVVAKCIDKFGELNG